MERLPAIDQWLPPHRLNLKLIASCADKAEGSTYDEQVVSSYRGVLIVISLFKYISDRFSAKIILIHKTLSVGKDIVLYSLAPNFVEQP